MDTTGVTETGAPGAANPSRGDRDGASESSGSQDPGGIPPRRGQQAGTATPERDAPSDGGGDGRVCPSLPPHGAGGTGGSVFPSLPPHGAGGVDGGVFPSLPPEGAGGKGGRSSTTIKGVTSRGGKYRPSQPLARHPLWDSRSGKSGRSKRQDIETRFTCRRRRCLPPSTPFVLKGRKPSPGPNFPK